MDHLPDIECSDRRLRNSDKTLLLPLDKARSVLEWGREQSIVLGDQKEGDRKQEKKSFFANGGVFFLDLLSHRRLFCVRTSDGLGDTHIQKPIYF